MAELPAFLEKETAGLPNWAWILVVGAGVGAAYVLPKFFGKPGNTAQTGTDSGSTNGIGLAVDPTTGLPYAVEGLVPGGGTAGTGIPGGTTNQPTLQQELGLIRQRGNGSTQNYDKAHTGVPIRSTATGTPQSEIGYAPWGTTIKITGPAVQGSTNMGTNLWYPVTLSNGVTGYISAFDFTDVNLYRQNSWPNG